MKKFIFTLQAVYNYKLTVEKKQKDDLKKAQNALRLLREEEARLEESFLRNSEALDLVLEKNENVAEELPKFDAYFRFLREAKANLQERIEAAEAEKNRILNILITTMKEIKVYEKLREEQMKAHVEEVAREDAKEIDDIVSFQTISELDMDQIDVNNSRNARRVAR